MQHQLMVGPEVADQIARQVHRAMMSGKPYRSAVRQVARRHQVTGHAVRTVVGDSRASSTEAPRTLWTLEV